MPWRLIWPVTGAVLLAAVVAGLPVLHGRVHYEQFRRLRVVADGRVFRSGQLYGDGFREAHRRYGFRTVVNLQEEDEAVDPKVPKGYFQRAKESESQVCADLGVTFLPLRGGVLDRDGAGGRPELIDQVLEVFDDESRYPILFHCKAGLHRTGLIAAVYRMEYEGWTRTRALEELRANGFGFFKATSDNEYVRRYFFEFAPGVRRANYQWPARRAPRVLPAGPPKPPAAAPGEETP